MKVLLDGCVWRGAASVLASAGHDVEAVADWPQDPGDKEILSRAFQASQVIVTIDKDFGELAVSIDCLTEVSCVLSASVLSATERSRRKSWRSTRPNSTQARS